MEPGTAPCICWPHVFPCDKEIYFDAVSLFFKTLPGGARNSGGGCRLPRLAGVVFALKPAYMFEDCSFDLGHEDPPTLGDVLGSLSCRLRISVLVRWGVRLP